MSFNTKTQPQPLQCIMCDQEGEPRECQKDGPNKGRTFYSCPSCPSTSGQGKRFIGWAGQAQTQKIQNNPYKRPRTEPANPSIVKETADNHLSALETLIGAVTVIVEYQRKQNRNISNLSEKMEELKDLVSSMNEFTDSVEPELEEPEQKNRKKLSIKHLVS